ncbi:MAG: nucleotidyltransferase domain-containing protein [Gemmatimonadota bacterium]
MRTETVLDRRRTRQRELLDFARRFAEGIDAELGVRAVVVFGSVARGDFNQWSDIDVLIIAEGLHGRLLERLDRLGWRLPLVRPIPWTPAEWEIEVRRGNPIAREALESGVWLVGSAAELPGPIGPPSSETRG